ncbi:hypothetical protein J132_09446 [Termitomyces sp. J132]|nr:hypothetical protein J132_09446 [Termitomyces sp. J132]
MSNVPFTSNTAQLPDGIDIFFTDSGPPPGSTDYTTIIVLHGIAFTGDNLKKLHNHAHAFNLRTVIWNRRDYVGSSKYTSDELEDLNHGQRAFLDRLGVHLAQFLLWFIEQHNVPKVNADRTTGGFAIMGWSLGNLTAITLFSHKNLFAPETYELLGKYVKNLIIYDATLLAFGWRLPPSETPPNIYDPLTTFTTEPPEVAQHNFDVWVSSYYDHPKNPESVRDLHFARRTEFATSDTWSAEDLKAFHDYDAFRRSDMPVFQPTMQSIIRELSDRVLGLDDNTSTMAFPNCPIIYLRPTRTTWRCYWFGIQAERTYDEHRRNGRNVRTAIFLPIEGGNHFAHWDMPQKVMEALAFGVHNDSAIV